MRIKYLSILLSLLFFINVHCQHMYPLEIGNTWIYNDYPGTVKFTIVDDSVLVDSFYYYHIIIQQNGLSQYASRYSRREDDFYIAKMYIPGNDGDQEIYYREGAYVGEVWYQTYDPVSYTEVLDSLIYNVFGQIMVVRRLEVNSYNNLVRNFEFFTEEIGMIASSDFWGTPTRLILGCVVDKVVYGDTSFYITVGIDNNEPVNEYRLYQNYPNPFNPTTTIEFKLPQNSMVTLRVFDVLGNEVAVLVNDELTAGMHSVEFNAESLPSGIYIYVIKNRFFMGAKKMTLLK